MTQCEAIRIATVFLLFSLPTLGGGWVSASPPVAVPIGRPADVGMDPAALDRIDALVEAEISSGSIPGCVVCVLRHGRQIVHRSYGHRQLRPEQLPMQLDTLFDMASLTKPIATATSVMQLVERGEIRLNDNYGLHVEAFKQNGKEDVTIFQMLTHQAGFVPDSPLAEYADPAQIWPNLWRLGLTYPPTTRFVYSDVGFQMLGKLVEVKMAKSLDQYSRENIFQPLGMTETGFLPDETLRDRAATTEQREGRWMQGEVHDPRSYAMGGVAGHAGLFSTATDLARYGQMILNRGSYEGVRILSEATVKQMLTPHDVAGNFRGLGWDVRSRYSTNRGDLLSDQAIGHGGFTGTAMWIDPELDLIVIFLSNRVHPDGSGHANRLAGAIANVAAAAIEPETEASPSDAVMEPPQVRPGIDVLAAEDFRRLAGKRLGLITNHTGAAVDGKRTIDLLHTSNNAELVAIFSPEHGLEGKKDEPNIADAVDEATGLPVFSLYGENRRPTATSLEVVDTLVFDIQDIGTRFYTYISTMREAMQAATEHRKSFVVLDRPNPLAGLVVAGPMLDDGRQSFVACHSLPVQHGMTTGELAMMFATELQLDLDLTIVKAEGWSRGMRWDETGLTWINPSPNMRTWNQALLYPGIGLLETTNLSVGRGTDRPFETIGAPFIDERQFAQRLNELHLNGLRFIPRKFVPTSSKFQGEPCGGVDIVITHREAVNAVESGLRIGSVLRELYPTQWKYAGMDRLLGNKATLAWVESGDPLQAELEAITKIGLDDFLHRRARFLIYPARR